MPHSRRLAAPTRGYKKPMKPDRAVGSTAWLDASDGALPQGRSASRLFTNARLEGRVNERVKRVNHRSGTTSQTTTPDFISLLAATDAGPGPGFAMVRSAPIAAPERATDEAMATQVRPASSEMRCWDALDLNQRPKDRRVPVARAPASQRLRCADVIVAPHGPAAEVLPEPDWASLRSEPRKTTANFSQTTGALRLNSRPRRWHSRPKNAVWARCQ